MIGKGSNLLLDRRILNRRMRQWLVILPSISTGRRLDPDRQPHEHYRTRPLTLLAKGLKKGDVEENDIINNNTDEQRDKPILHE